jgi:hypothetical protein
MKTSVIEETVGKLLYGAVLLVKQIIDLLGWYAITGIPRLIKAIRLAQKWSTELKERMISNSVMLPLRALCNARENIWWSHHE